MTAVLHSSISKIVVSIFLITGTCVGGGMLALPVAGGQMGFIPAAIVLSLAFVFMTITGLLYLELSTLLQGESHIITMANKFFGYKGKFFCWVVYLFIGYESLVAYLSEGSRILLYNLQPVVGMHPPFYVGSLIYAAMFALLMVRGSHMVDRINTGLFIMMVIVFCLMIGFRAGEFKASLLLRRHWDGRTFASLFPLAGTCSVVQWQ